MMEMKKYMTVNIPLLLLENYTELGLTDKQLIYVIKLMNINKRYIDVEKIIEDKVISRHGLGELIAIDIFSIETIEGQMVVDMNGFYLELSGLFEKDTNILEEGFIERVKLKLNRKIDKLELIKLSDWFDNNFTTVEIERAIELALVNGTDSFNYIDKILYNDRNKENKDTSLERKFEY